MNRKRQIWVFIIIIPLLYFSFFRLGGYYLTAESVFYACEKGLLYGPSEKILAEYELPKGGKLIVGKWGENLSAIPAERAFGLLWKLKSGGVSGLILCDKVVTAYLFSDGRVIGLTSNQDVKEVSCTIEYGDSDKPFIREVTMTVDQDGYFTGNWGKKKDDDYEYISYLEGRNGMGQVIYRDGKSPEGAYYIDGVLNDTEG
ncbi:hypothetical protein [Anaerotignum sp.]|uniref:hypothetical protein n=1 Tax=Anaerotignum sp. TaxID=2039241 RepID=UPI00289756CF|nr:hypothetical protein [Anaerotignum sp.]